MLSISASNSEAGTLWLSTSLCWWSDEDSSKRYCFAELPFSSLWTHFSQAITDMVAKACQYVDQCPDEPTTLKMIDTLRTVTAGKVKLPLKYVLDMKSNFQLRSTSKSSAPDWPWSWLRSKKPRAKSKACLTLTCRVFWHSVHRGSRHPSGATGWNIWINGEAGKGWIHSWTNQALHRKARLCPSCNHQQEDQHAFLRGFIDSRSQASLLSPHASACSAQWRVCSRHGVCWLALTAHRYVQMCKHYRSIFDTPSIQEDESGAINWSFVS